MQESVRVLQVTRSLLHVVLVCRLAELRDCSSCRCLQVPRFCADSLLYLGSIIGDICRTVSQDCCVDVMATGNSQPEADRKGIDFKLRSWRRTTTTDESALEKLRCLPAGGAKKIVPHFFGRGHAERKCKSKIRIL